MVYAVRNRHTKRVIEGGFGDPDTAQAHIDKLNQRWPESPQDDLEVFNATQNLPTFHLVTYPFPLLDGGMAYLQLPPDLTTEEADRLRNFLSNLVVEPAGNDAA